MGNFQCSQKIILFVLSIVLAQDLGGVICRPGVVAGVGSTTGLNTCIADAELSAEDYIIDLGGGIYTYSTGYEGSGYALPTIGSEHGMLSIINGTIERSRESGTDNFAILNIVSGAYLTLFNITIENGASSGAVSAINNFGTLSLENCLLQNNSIILSSLNYAGAIYNSGTIDSIVNCMFVNNSANGTGDLETFNSGAIINNSGAIINEINQSTFSYNSVNCPTGCTASGGGIGNFGSSIGSIINSVFNTNSSSSATSSGGGIYNSGNITNLSNSTFYGNQVGEDGNGGAIFNNNTISINNCTISGNTAGGNGGGIFNNFGTISNLYSNIVANNTSDDGSDITNVGSISNEGYNLVGATSGTDIMDGMNGDIVIGYLTDPLLGPLQDNGGITYTMALLPGSLAINNGYNPYSLLYDQRGSPYFRVVCSRPDIGAYELQTCP